MPTHRRQSQGLNAFKFAFQKTTFPPSPHLTVPPLFISTNSNSFPYITSPNPISHHTSKVFSKPLSLIRILFHFLIHSFPSSIILIPYSYFLIGDNQGLSLVWQQVPCIFSLTTQKSLQSHPLQNNGTTKISELKEKKDSRTGLRFFNPQ